MPLRRSLANWRSSMRATASLKTCTATTEWDRPHGVTQRNRVR
jgi:hypothetical protein